MPNLSDVYRGQHHNGNISPINDAEVSGGIFTEADRAAARAMLAAPLARRHEHADTIERLQKLATAGRSYQALYFLQRQYVDEEQIVAEQAAGIYRGESGLVMDNDRIVGEAWMNAEANDQDVASRGHLTLRALRIEPVFGD